MASLLRQPHYWYGAAALASAALVWYWPAGESTPAASPDRSAVTLSDGMQKSAPPDSGKPSPELAADDAQAPAGLSTDASGRLQPDQSLRMVFEYFLVRGEGASLDARAARLQSHLAHQVGGLALQQVQALALQYLAYVRAYDELLSAQHISLTPGTLPNSQQLNQLIVWQQQRARLRSSSFAPALADLWFGADDSTLLDAIAELRARSSEVDGTGTSSAASQESESNMLRAQRMHNPEQDRARDAELSELFAQSTTTYQDAAAAETRWRERYLNYRNAASRLQAREPAERRRQLEALQHQIFPTESERIRARASSIE